MKRSRRRRLSRILTVVMLVAVGAGTFAAVKKLRPAGRPAPSLVTAERSAPVDSTPEAKAIVPEQPRQIQVPKTEPRPIAPRQKSNIPATRPAIPTMPLPPIQPPIAPGANPLADAKAKFEGGDPVMARRILSEATAAGRISGEQTAAAHELLTKLSEQLIFSRRIYRDDPYTLDYTVQPGQTLQKLAPEHDVTWELLCRVNGIGNPTTLRAFQRIKIPKGPFHAVVSKSTFTMDLYLGGPGGPGSALVTSYPVGLGKHDSTPAGKWIVTRGKKLKNPAYYSPRGEGVFASSDPRNPLGKYWLGLTGIDGQAAGQKSYGVHGTNDVSTIGKQESMGCIRLKNEDVALVYELLVEGKSIVLVKD